jgi:hypothetical protein
VLIAHIGDRNREIKPFRVREDVPTAMLFVLFAPVLAFICGMGRGRLVLFENESRCTENDEGENGEKTENPVGEDIHTTKRLRMVTKFGEESVGVCYNIWFRWLLFDGIPTCPYRFDELAGTDVVESNDEERYCCEEWR